MAPTPKPVRDGHLKITAQPRGRRYVHGVMRRGIQSTVATLLAAALVFAPSLGASASTGGTGPVEVTRYGGADRYETSLLVAEAVATEAGGSLDEIVMVSGRHWYDAVVAAGYAGRVNGAVLMTPPGGLRDDALSFLKRVKAKRVTVVTTGDWPNTTVSPAVKSALEDAGVTVYGIGGSDRYATGTVVAEWLARNQSVSGKVAIIANGEVFADALVAGPLAARRGIPILLNPQDALHSDVGGFLDDAGIEQVVLMGGTAALSADVESAITAMDISVDRMAGASRYETAVLTAAFAAKHVGGDCFAGTDVGLARARVPFDSFSAAALLARLCAPLVLTEPAAIPTSTAAFLDDYRDAAGRDTVQLTVFGGEAAVSQAALNTYLGVKSAEDDTASDSDDSAQTTVSCGAGSDEEPVALLPSELHVEEPDWSPDCKQIAYVNSSALWVMDQDGRNARELLSLVELGIGNPAWSPDGTKIAFDVISSDETFDYAGQRHYIYVANADGTGAVKLTSGKVEDQAPSWSPDGSRIAFNRETWTDRTVSPPEGADSFIVVMDTDGSNLVELATGGSWEKYPTWSPDGTQFAIHSDGLVATMNVDGTNIRTWRVRNAWLSKLSWSPDGTQIAFSHIPNLNDRFEDGTAEIAVLDVATGDVTKIATMDGADINPDWSADGKRIVFNSFEQQGLITHLYVVDVGDP